MRLATLALDGGATTAAVQVDGQWRGLPAADLSSLLAGPAWSALAGRDEPPADLLGPVLDAAPVNPLPAPRKVICCGLNYGEHIAETGRELPAHPTLFAKHADTLTGPGDDVMVPADVQLDWEAELAVVVGAPLRHADQARAREGIAGYTVANDISARDWQRRTLQWFQGKAWDRTTPVGPLVVTPDEVDPVAGLDVTCWVSGERVQHGNTRTLVFDAAALLAYISTFTELRPGDLVLTGTPGGVGMAQDPPRFLADGDVVETAVEGIGTLRNTVRLVPTGAPSTPSPERKEQ